MARVRALLLPANDVVDELSGDDTVGFPAMEPGGALPPDERTRPPEKEVKYHVHGTCNY